MQDNTDNQPLLGNESVHAQADEDIDEHVNHA